MVLHLKFVSFEMLRAQTVTIDLGPSHITMQASPKHLRKESLIVILCFCENTPSGNSELEDSCLIYSAVNLLPR